MVLVVLTPWCSLQSLVPLALQQPSWVVKVTTPLVQVQTSLTSLWLVVLVLTASTPLQLVTTLTNSTILGGDGNDTLQFAGGATSSIASEVKLVMTPSPW